MVQIIPTGWEEKKIWEITDWDKRFQSVTKGKQRKILSFKHILAETMKTISVDDGDIKLLATGKFDGYTTESLAGNNLNEGEVLTLPSGGTASIKYYNGKFVDSGNIIAQSADKKSYYLKYIYYYLISINSFVDSKYKGASIKHPYMPEILEITVPLPSLPEQERIVAKLDEAFETIDKLKANAEQNLTNSKELFEGSLNETFIKNTDNWNNKTLEEIISKEQYSMKRGPFGSSLKKSYFVPKGIRVFEQYNPINNDPYWARYYITEEKYEELKAFTAKAGDLLVSCSGVTLGRIVELPDDVETGIINQALLKIKLDNSKILNKFFIYLFRSKDFQNKIFEYSQGVAIPNMVGVKELKRIMINYPSLPEQQKIVEKLDALQEQTKQLEAIYTQKIKECDELKQSILQKAFRGEL